MEKVLLLPGKHGPNLPEARERMQIIEPYRIASASRLTITTERAPQVPKLIVRPICSVQLRRDGKGADMEAEELRYPAQRPRSSERCGGPRRILHSLDAPVDTEGLIFPEIEEE